MFMFLYVYIYIYVCHRCRVFSCVRPKLGGTEGGGRWNQINTDFVMIKRSCDCNAPELSLRAFCSWALKVRKKLKPACSPLQSSPPMQVVPPGEAMPRAR